MKENGKRWWGGFPATERKEAKERKESGCEEDKSRIKLTGTSRLT